MTYMLDLINQKDSKHFFVRLCCLLFFCFSFSRLTSQTIIFDHLHTEDGLSELSVQAIYQDELERMWIATKDGLNLYDGKSIEVFRPIPGDSTSLIGHNIINITGNRKGKIYIHCMTGVHSYDLREEKFQLISGDGIERISMGKECLWASFRNKLYFLDRNTNKFGLYYTFSEGINITSILETEKGRLYIGTRESGLKILDPEKNESIIPISENIICTYLDLSKRLWIGTLKGGLYRVDPDGTIVNYKNDPYCKTSISNNFVRAINEDGNGNIWIGTFNGLNKLDVLQSHFAHFSHREQIRYSLGSNSIWCITKDTQGSFWIGSYYGGVDIFNPDYLFNFYSTTSNGSIGLCDGIVGRTLEDPEGNMWICSENSGLNFFNRKKNTFVPYLNKNIGINPKVNASIKDIYYDKDGNCIWIGTHLDGLHKMDLSSKKAVRINFTKNTAGNDYVRCIIPYEDKLLLGTHNSVYLFDKKTNSAHPLLENDKEHLSDRQIWDMFIDSKKRFWFSTSSEIYCYQLNNQELKIYRHDPLNNCSLQNGNLYVFAEDNKHQIWVGSAGGGISVLNEQDSCFRSFNTLNSHIIDNYVVDIACTPSDYLIVATNKGLSRFTIRTANFKNIYSYDIFPFSGLKERSLYITQSNELVVGGVYGMVILNENELDVEAKEYSLNLSALYVNNLRIKPGDKTGILKQSLNYTDEIELKSHKHTVFSIDFAVSNYAKTFHPVVYYKLEGFDSEWITASPNERITYTNLSAGNYKLILKSEVEQNSNFRTYKELKINVSPPFYKSTLALILYCIFIIATIVLFFVYYSAHVRLKSSLIYAEKEKMNVAELNRLKLQFFTNISHELRTPITLIISQLESILRIGDLSSLVSRKTLNVLRNTDKMNRLVTELLDFTKQELGYLKLRIYERDLVHYMGEICFPFSEYAIEKEIHFQLNLPDSPIVIWFDSVQLEKVVHNLLINAFRFTPKNGTIKVDVFQNGRSGIIQISDSGCGIPPESISHIFDRFYQADKGGNNQGSSGIGLALSKGIVELHGGKISVENNTTEGCMFSVYLPFGDIHFDLAKVIKVGGEVLTKSEIEFINPNYLDPEQSTSYKQNEIEKYSILLVEDNQEVMPILIDIFTPFCDIHQASNGVQAFIKAEEVQPDLILSDIMMPEMDGLELCKKIKSNLNTSHIPLILLTARAGVEHIVFGLANGADDYIIKPFNSSILLARCNNIVNNRKSLQAIYCHNPNLDPKVIAVTHLDQQLLDKAIKIIEENLMNFEFNVDKFAKEMNLGRTNLFRKIKGITGHTPNDFILNIRLKKSLILLKEHPEIPIYQIAEMVGFEEQTYFMKCFKKYFGKTPSQYRNQ